MKQWVCEKVCARYFTIWQLTFFKISEKWTCVEFTSYLIPTVPGSTRTWLWPSQFFIRQNKQSINRIASKYIPLSYFTLIETKCNKWVQYYHLMVKIINCYDYLHYYQITSYLRFSSKQNEYVWRLLKKCRFKHKKFQIFFKCLKTK